MIFLNKKNPFIYGFVVSMVAFLIALLQPSAAPSTVAVAFDTAGGTPVDMVTLPGGGRLASIPTTTREGFTFEHWLKGTEEVTLNTVFNSNTTVRAVFETIEYTIVFNTNGGDLLEETATVEYGDDFTLPTPIKAGSVFEGWYTEPEFTNRLPETIEVLQDYMVYAKWSLVGVDVVSVSYFSEGLGLIDSLYVAPNTTITLMTPPERVGYEFNHWINGLTSTPIVGGSLLVTQDVVLFADWISIGGLVTITFDSQGGTPIAPIQVPAGSNWQNPEDVPFLEEGYQFLNWITNCNFDGFEVSCTTLDESYVVTDDMTVLARYDYMVPLANMRFDSYERDGRVIGYVLASIEDFQPEETISTLVLPARFSGQPVVAIGDYVFDNVDYLDKVIIPENVKYIGENSFYSSSIKEVFLPSTLVEIGYASFADSDLEIVHFTEETDLKYIFTDAFNGTQLTDFHLPDSVVYIGNDTFNTSPLTSFTFETPSQLSYIGDNAFSQTELVEITLPEGLKTLQDEAFSNISTLRSVHIPSTVDFMNDRMFLDSPIETLTFGANSRLAFVGRNLFGNDLRNTPIYNNSTDEFVQAGPLLIAYKGNQTDGEALVIPNTVKIITDDAFDSANPLVKSSLVFPNDLRFIGESAFQSATIDSSVVIPDGVYIEYNAFANLTINGDLTIGAIKEIRNYAFMSLVAEDVILEPNPTAHYYTLDGYIFRFANILTLTMGEGYSKIPYGFVSSSQVRHLYFPDSVVEIQSGAIGSYLLESVNFAGSSLLIYVDSNVFSGEVLSSPWYQNAKPYIILKNNLVRLDLSSLSNGASIVIPNGVKVLNNYVYNGWISYESFDFNEIEIFRNAPFYQWNLTFTSNQTMNVDKVSYFGSSFSSNIQDLLTTGKLNLSNNFEINYQYLIQNNERIPEDFKNALNFDNQGFKMLGNTLFQYNPNFDLTPEEVVIPSQVEIIASYAFQSITLPENFSLNEGLLYVEENAFYETVFFDGQVTLPSTLEYINNYGFGLSNIQSVTIPASVEYIGYYGFYSNQLTQVEFEDLNHLKIQREAFGDISYQTKDLSNLFKNYLSNQMVIIDGLFVTYLGTQTSVVVPEGVVSISTRAFSSRDSFIQTITLPSTLKVIHQQAFASVELLHSIDFSNVVSLNYIGDSAFEYTSIRSLNIDAPITEIDPYALEEMPSLLDYELNLVNPTHLYLSYGVDLLD